MSIHVADCGPTTTAGLSMATLARVPIPLRPRIAPGTLEVGIVHVGLGAFHRAHQAVYTEDAMALDGDRTWAICGVSPRGSSILEALRRQDGLYTLVQRERAVEVRVMGSIREVRSMRDERQEILDRLADPRTRIVSLTVTEAAYLVPDGVIGLVRHGLHERRRTGGGPITALCCDNIPRNGDFLRQRILSSTAGDPDLGRWIESNVTFPSSVVDRIVPAPTEFDRTTASAIIGLRDECAVPCEAFSQWVIEDDFVAGRPRWENTGVVFDDHVEQYQLVKLRMLNGAHSALAYLGVLAGYELIADALEDTLAREFVQRYLLEEVAPTLTAPPAVDLTTYAHSVITRFANRSLGHLCIQVSSDGSQKLPIRVLPTLRSRLASGASIRSSTLLIAAWMRYVSSRQSDQGVALPVADPMGESISALVGPNDDASIVVDRLLGMKEIFGEDLVHESRVRDELVDWLEVLSMSGARGAMTLVLQEEN